MSLLADINEAAARRGVRTYGQLPVAPTRRTVQPPRLATQPLGRDPLSLMAADARQRQQQPKQDDQPIWEQGLGILLNNPVTRTAMVPLNELAKPMRAAIYGLSETQRLLPDEIQRFSPVSEERAAEANAPGFWDTLNDPTYGFGKVSKQVGGDSEWAKWANRGIGLAGDIALDPFTYVTGGVGAGTRFAGRTGRQTLAAKFSRLGTSNAEELAQRAGKLGINAMTPDELAMIGIRRGGMADLAPDVTRTAASMGKEAPRQSVRWLGMPIPGTEGLSRRPLRRLNQARAYVGQAPGMSKLRYWRSPKGLEAANEKLATGRGPMSAVLAAELIDGNNAAMMAEDSFTKGFVRRVHQLSSKMKGSDGQNATRLAEQGQGVWPAVFEEAADEATRRGVMVWRRVEGVGTQGWVPHVQTPEGRKWLASDDTFAQELRREMGITIEDLGGDSGVLLRRIFVASDKPYTVKGRKLYLKDDTIDGINAAFKETFGLDFNILDDNITSIASNYLTKLGQDVGEVAMAKRWSSSKSMHVLPDNDKRVLQEVMDEAETNKANSRQLAEMKLSRKRLRESAKNLREETRKGMGVPVKLLTPQVEEALESVKSARGELSVKKLRATIFRDERTLVRNRKSAIREVDKEIAALEKALVASEKELDALHKAALADLEVARGAREEARADVVSKREAARDETMRELEANAQEMRIDIDTLRAVNERLGVPEQQVPLAEVRPGGNVGVSQAERLRAVVAPVWDQLNAEQRAAVDRAVAYLREGKTSLDDATEYVLWGGGEGDEQIAALLNHLDDFAGSDGLPFDEARAAEFLRRAGPAPAVARPADDAARIARQIDDEITTTAADLHAAEEALAEMDQLADSPNYARQAEARINLQAEANELRAKMAQLHRVKGRLHATAPEQRRIPGTGIYAEEAAATRKGEILESHVVGKVGATPVFDPEFISAYGGRNVPIEMDYMARESAANQALETRRASVAQQIKTLDEEIKREERRWDRLDRDYADPLGRPRPEIVREQQAAIDDRLKGPADRKGRRTGGGLYDQRKDLVAEYDSIPAGSAGLIPEYRDPSGMRLVPETTPERYEVMDDPTTGVRGYQVELNEFGEPEYAPVRDPSRTRTTYRKVEETTELVPQSGAPLTQAEVDKAIKARYELRRQQLQAIIDDTDPVMPVKPDAKALSDARKELEVLDKRIAQLSGQGGSRAAGSTIAPSGRSEAQLRKRLRELTTAWEAWKKEYRAQSDSSRYKYSRWQLNEMGEARRTQMAPKFTITPERHVAAMDVRAEMLEVQAELANLTEGLIPDPKTYNRKLKKLETALTDAYNAYEEWKRLQGVWARTPSGQPQPTAGRPGSGQGLYQKLEKAKQDLLDFRQELTPDTTDLVRRRTELLDKYRPLAAADERYRRTPPEMRRMAHEERRVAAQRELATLAGSERRELDRAAQRPIGQRIDMGIRTPRMVRNARGQMVSTEEEMARLQAIIDRPPNPKATPTAAKAAETRRQTAIRDLRKIVDQTAHRRERILRPAERERQKRALRAGTWKPPSDDKHPIRIAIDRPKSDTAGSASLKARVDRTHTDMKRAAAVTKVLVNAGVAPTPHWEQKLADVHSAMLTAQVKYQDFATPHSHRTLVDAVGDARRHAEFTLRYSAAINAGAEPGKDLSSHVLRNVLDAEREVELSARARVVKGEGIFDEEVDQMVDMLKGFIRDVDRGYNAQEWTRRVTEIANLPPAEQRVALRERIRLHEDWLKDRVERRDAAQAKYDEHLRYETVEETPSGPTLAMQSAKDAREVVAQYNREQAAAARANPFGMGSGHIERGPERTITREQYREARAILGAQAKNLLRRREGQQNIAEIRMGLHNGDLTIRDLFISEAPAAQNIRIYNALTALPERSRIEAIELMEKAGIPIPGTKAAGTRAEAGIPIASHQVVAAMLQSSDPALATRLLRDAKIPLDIPTKPTNAEVLTAFQQLQSSDDVSAIVKLMERAGIPIGSPIDDDIDIIDKLLTLPDMPRDRALRIINDAGISLEAHEANKVDALGNLMKLPKQDREAALRLMQESNLTTLSEIQPGVSRDPGAAARKKTRSPRVSQLRAGQRARLLKLLGEEPLPPTDMPYAQAHRIEMTEPKTRGRDLAYEVNRHERDIAGAEEVLKMMRGQLAHLDEGGLTDQLKAVQHIFTDKVGELNDEDMRVLTDVFGRDDAELFGIAAREFANPQDPESWRGMAIEFFRRILGEESEVIDDFIAASSTGMINVDKMREFLKKAAMEGARKRTHDDMTRLEEMYRALGFRYEDESILETLGYNRSKGILDEKKLRATVERRLNRERKFKLGAKARQLQDIDLRVNRLDSMSRALGKRSTRTTVPMIEAAERRAKFKVGAEGTLSHQVRQTRIARAQMIEEMVPPKAHLADWEQVLGAAAPRAPVGGLPGRPSGSLYKGSPQRKYQMLQASEDAMNAANTKAATRLVEIRKQLSDIAARKEQLGLERTAAEQKLFETEARRADIVEQLGGAPGAETPMHDQFIANLESKLDENLTYLQRTRGEFMEFREKRYDELTNTLGQMDEQLAQTRRAITDAWEQRSYLDARGAQLEADAAILSQKFPQKAQEVRRYVDDIREVAAARMDDPSPEMVMTETLLHNAADSAAMLAETDITIRELSRAIDKGDKGGLVVEPVMINELADGWVRIATHMLPDNGAGLAVRSDLRQAMMNIMEKQRTGDITRMIRFYTDFFKTYAVMSPGFQVRNAISAAFMNATEGVGMKYTAEAGRLWREWRRDPIGFEKRHNIGSLDPNHPPTRIGQAFEATFGSGAGGQFGERGIGPGSPLDRRAGKLFNNPLTRLSKWSGEWVEGPVRLALGLDSIDKGWDKFEALTRITRIHFNYSQVSKMDERMKLVVPFWTFMSRNMPLQVSQMWLKPKVYLWYNSLIRNIRSEDHPYTPSYWLEQGAFNSGLTVPFSGGDDLYLAPDLQHTRLQQDLAMLEDPSRLLSSLNPLYRVPLETAVTKRKLYTNQPFTGVPEPADRELAPFIPLLGLLGQLRRNPEGGRVLATDAGAYAMRSLFPPVQVASRLMPSPEDEFNKQRQQQTIMRWLGIPAYQLSQTAKEGEQRRQEFAARG